MTVLLVVFTVSYNALHIFNCYNVLVLKRTPLVLKFRTCIVWEMKKALLCLEMIYSDLMIALHFQ